MPIHRAFHFTIGTTNYALKDRFSAGELDSSKSYLFAILTADTTINFKFDSSITSNSIIEIFQGPTISVNGTFLLSPQSLLNIYSDPTITANGTLFYRYDTNSTLIKIHTLNLIASTNYLLKITPLDVSQTHTSLGLKSKDDLDNLKDILKSVNKIRESRSELVSMINSINNNTFTTSDTIPAIKKLAIAEKNIINMLLDIV